jgi:hypothetical protein
MFALSAYELPDAAARAYPLNSVFSSRRRGSSSFVKAPRTSVCFGCQPSSRNRSALFRALAPMTTILYSPNKSHQSSLGTSRGVGLAILPRAYNSSPITPAASPQLSHKLASFGGGAASVLYLRNLHAVLAEEVRVFERSLCR